MERVEQMKRNIVIVAVIVPLLLAAWVLAGQEKAFAQSVSSDQYSSAGTEQYVDGGGQQVPVRPDDPAYPGLDDTPDPSGIVPPHDVVQDHSQTVPPDPSQNPIPDQGNPIPDQGSDVAGQDPSQIPPQDPSQNPDITQDPSQNPDNTQDPSQIPPQADTEAGTGEQASGIVEQINGVVEQINGVVEQINGLIASLTGSSGTEGTQQQAQQPEQPQQVLQQMPQATPAPEAAQPLQADMGSSTDQMTDLMGQDIDPFWAQRFQGWAPYNSPNLVWYDQPLQTPCGEIKPEAGGSGHNYCSENETIYMSIPAAQTYAAKWGNFANVYQLAHEQGHHVQNELGSWKARNVSIPGNSRAFENQADCLAGVWANSAYGQSKIGEQQIREAIESAKGLADNRTIEQGATHGNDVERTGWFTQGFNSGDPSTCAT